MTENEAKVKRNWMERFKELVKEAEELWQEGLPVPITPELAKALREKEKAEWRAVETERSPQVMEILMKLDRCYEGLVPIEEIKRLAAAEGIEESFVMHVIEEEKMRGHLYEPKPRFIRRAVV